MRNLKNHTIAQLKNKYLKATDHPKLKMRFDELNKKCRSALKPLQVDIDEIHELSREIRKLNWDAGMKSFYDVEWHKKIDPNPLVIEKLETTVTQNGAIVIYSGLGF